MTSEQDSTRTIQWRMAVYGPVLVALALALVVGSVMSPYTAGMAWPGTLVSGLLLGVLGKDIGEVLVARYNL